MAFLRLAYTTALCSDVSALSLYQSLQDQNLRSRQATFAFLLPQTYANDMLTIGVASPDCTVPQSGRRKASLCAFVAISQAYSFFVPSSNSVPCVQGSSLVHDILIKHTSWNPAFADLLLQTGNLRQTLCVFDKLLHPGPLFLVQLDARLLSSSIGNRCGVGERFVRACGKNALCQFCWLFVCAEDLLCFCALGVLDFLVVEEANLRRKVQKPVTVVLDLVSMTGPIFQQRYAHFFVCHRIFHQ